MNFSEYTLISLGDSFTFGQGTYMDGISSIPELMKSKRYSHADYRNNCNSKSYTKVLEKTLGFKKSVNLGNPGICNERILLNLREVLRNKTKDQKFFICVNLTSPQRFSLVQSNPITKNYGMYTIRPSDINARIEFDKNDLHLEREVLHHNGPKNLWDNYFTYIDVSENVLHRHIQLMSSLTDVLNHSGCPFIMFDILNDTDYHLDKHNINITFEPKEYDNCLHAPNRAGVEFNLLSNYFSAYCDLIKRQPHYFNYHCINEDEYPGKLPNSIHNSFLGLVKRNGRENKLPQDGKTTCQHWTSESHIYAASVLKHFIQKQDYTYITKE